MKTAWCVTIYKLMCNLFSSVYPASEILFIIIKIQDIFFKYRAEKYAKLFIVESLLLNDACKTMKKKGLH